MSPSLQKKIKNILSYCEQLEKHSKKLVNAWDNGDIALVVYYRKETQTFILEIERLFEWLNKHEKVQELYVEFQRIQKILDDNFHKYGK